MDRVAVFVDAGYLSSGHTSERVCGTTSSVSSQQAAYRRSLPVSAGTA